MVTKNRMSMIDIRATVSELKHRVTGLRLANLYDINSKTFLLKFAKPDTKVYVIVESGVRLHTTLYEREKSKMPNHFILKLRKYIRTKKVHKVEQLGIDRVVDFSFRTKDNMYHLICEFYAKGNVVLTNENYEIIALLRTHKLEESAKFAVGEKYPIGQRRQFEPIDPDHLKSVLKDTSNQDSGIKQLLVSNCDYGTGFIEHCLLKIGLKGNDKVSSISKNDEVINKLKESFKDADDFIKSSESHIQKGYIILQTDAEKKLQELKLRDEQLERERQLKNEEEILNKEENGSSSPNPALKNEKEPSIEELEPNDNVLDELESGISSLSLVSNLEEIKKEKKEKKKERERNRKVYDEFTPYLYNQFKDRSYIEFVTFDQCVDEFFSAIESVRSQNRNVQVEKNVNKKVEKIKREQEERIEELKETTENFDRIAQLIELNLPLVDEAIQVIVSAVSQSIDWDDIKKVINIQKKEGDPVAKIIHRLKLDMNQITLELSSPYEPDLKPEKVDIDITSTAYTNAQTYYGLKKKTATKRGKTIETSQKAIEMAEKKKVESLKKKTNTNVIQAMRKRFWFEKFYWFISSENYLVVSGRDAQQNELLVKKYMEKDDIYVHAEIHGASSCVIKNPTRKPIPQITLNEAGTMTVCRSSAWKEKVIANAYWVFSNQVSKTAQSGEYLSTGGFMIRGKKNFLAPNQLVMGLGLLFKIDESCIPNHLHERQPRQDLDELAADMEETQKILDSLNANKDEDEQDMQENASNSNKKKDTKKSEEEGASSTKNLSVKERKKVKQLKKKGMKEDQAVEHVIKLRESQSTSNKQEKKKEKKVEVKKEFKKSKRGRTKKKDISDDEDEDLESQIMKIINQSRETKKKEENPPDSEEEGEQEEEKVIDDDSKENNEEEGEDDENDGIDEDEDNNEVKQLMEEENIPFMEEEDKMKLTALDSLTGLPRDDDIILFAIPTCAPYSVIKNYKYKVKLLPGGQKRGKAGKLAMQLMINEAKKLSDKEYHMAKGVDDNDTVSVLIGDVRIGSSTTSLGSKKKKSKKKK